MNVALSFPGCHRRGGVERILLECANYLQDRGHQTHVYAMDFDRAALDPSVSLHPIKPTRSSFERVLRFAQECKRAMDATPCRFDAIGSFGVVCPPDGTIWVQSVHRTWLTISRNHRGLRGRLRQRLNPIHPLILSLERQYFVERRYKKVIAVTDQIKQELVDHYRVPAEDIEIVPNGFAPDQFNPARAHALRASSRERLGLRDSDRAILFVANELERKGFGPLLRAIHSLGDTRTHLIAAGRFSPAPYVSEIRSLGLADRVHFVGSVNDITEYFAAADLFALPTQYEAWGLVVVEALACGVPVITSRLAGASVAVCEGQTGLLLDDPGDVSEIARHLKALLPGVGLSPSEIAGSVSEYTWSRVLQRYEAVLAQAGALQPVMAGVS